MLPPQASIPKVRTVSASRARSAEPVLPTTFGVSVKIIRSYAGPKRFFEFLL